MYRLALDDESFDAVTVHQVLHYAAEPTNVIFEATRVLRPQGRLVIVDFAPHRLEQLRAEHAHRRLGFADDEVTGWCREAGLETESVRTLEGEPLTVKIWVAVKSGRLPADAATGRAERDHREAAAT
jgi:ArsR family transcriptional regulator